MLCGENMENEILKNFEARKEFIKNEIEKKTELFINRIKSNHLDSAITIIGDLKKLTEQQYFIYQIIEGYH